MHKWEEVEEYIFDNQVTSFNCEGLALRLHITNREATSLIQSHLKAQRRFRSTTLYVLHRRGRCQASVWHVGHRSNDVRDTTRQCVDDAQVKFRAGINDLRRMAQINPRCEQLVENIAAAVTANLNLMATAMP